MASRTNSNREWKFLDKRAKIKDKLRHLKSIFWILTFAEVIREHPEAAKDFYFRTDINELVVELQVFAEETADLYANQKTTDEDFRMRDLSFRNLTHRAQLLAIHSKIPEGQFVAKEIGKF